VLQTLNRLRNTLCPPTSIFRGSILDINLLTDGGKRVELVGLSERIIIRRDVVKKHDNAAGVIYIYICFKYPFFS